MYTSCGYTTLTHLLSDLKVAINRFESLPEQEKILQQVQSALQTTLTLKPCDQTDIMVLAMSATDGDAVWIFWQLCISKLQHTPLRFWSKAMPSVKSFPFKNQCFSMLLALSRD